MKPYVYSSTGQTSVFGLLPELLRSRELLVDLIQKDLKARHRRTSIGFGWAIIEPLLLTLILTVVFSVAFKGREAAASYAPAAMILCGLVSWQFFSTSIGRANRSLLEHGNLIQKVYFPREVIPIAAAAYTIVNFTIGFTLLLMVHIILGGSLTIQILWALPIFAIEFLLIIGLALCVSMLTVLFRDMGYVTDIAMVFGFYCSPVFYRFEDVRAGLGWLSFLYQANPMVGLITALRIAVLEGAAPPALLLLWPTAAGILLLVVGVVFFRRNAPYIADNI